MHVEAGADQAAWLMLAAGDDREHGGNDGYDDAPSVHYSWDSTVPNHQLPQHGHVIVLWDKNTLLGASVIERVERGEQQKTTYRCPDCGMASIKRRKEKQPRYRCYKCERLFDEAVPRTTTVVTYRSHHGNAWIDLAGQLTGDELRGLCTRPKSQLSIRQLDYPRFRSAVEASPGEPRLSPVEAYLGQMLYGGHRVKLVRTRVGQAGFRSRLLKAYGDECAFTGPSPRDTLEAAHLYSFAATGKHRDDGGLLLRRDVHRLFDLGHLAVNPSSLTIDVSGAVKPYGEYGRLQDEPLRVKLTGRQVHWVAQHWAMHRSR